MRNLGKTLLLTGVFALIAGFSGCGQTPSAENNQKSPAAAQAGNSSHDDADEHAHEVGQVAAHDHSGWWCNEHGVPEEECGQCNAKLAKEFQKKGDWCKDHDRPDSQCFICHPEKEAQFAARYEAKYGKKPPKPDLN